MKITQLRSLLEFDHRTCSMFQVGLFVCLFVCLLFGLEFLRSLELSWVGLGLFVWCDVMRCVQIYRCVIYMHRYTHTHPCIIYCVRASAGAGVDLKLLDLGRRGVGGGARERICKTKGEERNSLLFLCFLLKLCDCLDLIWVIVYQWM